MAQVANIYSVTLTAGANGTVSGEIEQPAGPSLLSAWELSYGNVPAPGLRIIGKTSGVVYLDIIDAQRGAFVLNEIAAGLGPTHPAPPNMREEALFVHISRSTSGAQYTIAVHLLERRAGV